LLNVEVVLTRSDGVVAVGFINNATCLVILFTSVTLNSVQI